MNQTDLDMMVNAIGAAADPPAGGMGPSPLPHPAADLNRDGAIDAADLAMLMADFGRSASELLEGLEDEDCRPGLICCPDPPCLCLDDPGGCDDPVGGNEPPDDPPGHGDPPPPPPPGDDPTDPQPPPGGDPPGDPCAEVDVDITNCPDPPIIVWAPNAQGVMTMTFTAEGAPPGGVYRWTASGVVQFTSPSNPMPTVPPTGPIANVWITGPGHATVTVTYTVEINGRECEAIDTCEFDVIDIDIDVDTDRDGEVKDDEDEEGEDQWTPPPSGRGAIFTVNYDRDGDNFLPDGLLATDSIHIDDNGEVTFEDMEINGPGDVDDIAPMVIRDPVVMPQGLKVFLKADNAADLRRMHLFAQRSAGQSAIWGRHLDQHPQGDTTPYEEEIEITERVAAGVDSEMGIEALFFRYVGAAAPENLRWDGEIEITLEYRWATGDGQGGGGDIVIGSDTVKLRVAPWLMVGNDRPLEKVWVAAVPGEPGQPLQNADLVNAIPASVRATVSFTDAGTQWMQDHVEVGYYQRPGGPLVACIFRMPYYRGPGVPQPKWPLLPQYGVLDGERAVFQIGIDPSGEGQQIRSGDYGGNLELMPPFAGAPQGRAVIGNTSSLALQQFVQSQEAQPLLVLPVEWLKVAHVDEVVSFVNGSQVLVADSLHGITTLQQLPVDQQEKLVLFTTSGRGLVGNCVADSAPGSVVLHTGIDHTAPANEHWRYVRISDCVISGSGAEGLVGEIDPLSRANGSVSVTMLWDTTRFILEDSELTQSHRKWAAVSAAPMLTVWPQDRAPKAGDRFVLVDDTTEWRFGTPAFVTLKELLADADMALFNQEEAHAEVSALVTILMNANPGLTEIALPSLFVGNRALPPADSRSSFAYTPGLVNLLQLTGVGAPLAPKPIGPVPDGFNRDMFEWYALQGVPNLNFVDVWDSYHRLMGEVHCGTATQRTPPENPWWSIQP